MKSYSPWKVVNSEEVQSPRSPGGGVGSVVQQRRGGRCHRGHELPVVVNEVESNGDPSGDFVELANKDTNNSVDSGLRATQKAAAHRTRKA